MKPDRYAYIANRGAQDDSPNIEEAFESPERAEWEKSLRANMNALERTDK